MVKSRTLNSVAITQALCFTHHDTKHRLVLLNTTTMKAGVILHLSGVGSEQRMNWVPNP